MISEKADAQPTVLLQAAPAQQDTARARPAVLLSYSGTAAMDDRWRWALQTANARRLQQYWIGYVIPRQTARGDWHYLDRASPVGAANDTWIAGHMRFNGEFRNLKFSGITLNSLIGDYAAADYAVFLAFDATSRSPRLVRVRFANFVFPMHFNRWPLLWLGESSDAESVRVLAALEKQAASEEVRGDLPAAIGAHDDARAAMPVLLRWLDDVTSSARFRSDVVEAIAYQDSPEALSALARVARSNDEMSVRAEAVEALGDLPFAAAADTLINFTRTLNSERLLLEAVEALGSRQEPPVAAALEALTRAERKSVRAEAMETLTDLPEGRGARIVARLARNAPDPFVRIEALESLGDLHDARVEAPAVLSEAAFRDPDLDVQVKAAEALGDLDAPQAVEQLARIVSMHRDLRVQIAATEALADVHPQEPAIRALQRIVLSHPEMRVRMEAMEALADTGEPRLVADFIKEVLGSNASLEVKLEALETLGDLADEAGVALLRHVAASNERMLREKAGELLEDRREQLEDRKN